MDQNNQQPTDNTQAQEPKQIETQVTCPHCGKQFEVKVEVPEANDTPKMTWEI